MDFINKKISIYKSKLNHINILNNNYEELTKQIKFIVEKNKEIYYKKSEIILIKKEFFILKNNYNKLKKVIESTNKINYSKEIEKIENQKKKFEKDYNKVKKLNLEIYNKELTKINKNNITGNPKKLNINYSKEIKKIEKQEKNSIKKLNNSIKLVLKQYELKLQKNLIKYNPIKLNKDIKKLLNKTNKIQKDSKLNEIQILNIMCLNNKKINLNKLKRPKDRNDKDKKKHSMYNEFLFISTFVKMPYNLILIPNIISNFLVDLNVSLSGAKDNSNNYTNICTKLEEDWILERLFLKEIKKIKKINAYNIKNEIVFNFDLKEFPQKKSKTTIYTLYAYFPLKIFYDVLINLDFKKLEVIKNPLNDKTYNFYNKNNMQDFNEVYYLKRENKIKGLKKLNLEKEKLIKSKCNVNILNNKKTLIEEKRKELNSDENYYEEILSNFGKDKNNFNEKSVEELILELDYPKISIKNKLERHKILKESIKQNSYSYKIEVEYLMLTLNNNNKLFDLIFSNFKKFADIIYFENFSHKITDVDNFYYYDLVKSFIYEIGESK